MELEAALEKHQNIQNKKHLKENVSDMVNLCLHHEFVNLMV